VGSLTSHNPTIIHGLFSFPFSYVDDVRTSQEAHASTASYRDRFPFLYVDDVRTSQKIYLCASMVCYRARFTFLYTDDVRTL
jgi:hypothetical protein